MISIPFSKKAKEKYAGLRTMKTPHAMLQGAAILVLFIQGLMLLMGSNKKSLSNEAVVKLLRLSPENYPKGYCVWETLFPATEALFDQLMKGGPNHMQAMMQAMGFTSERQGERTQRKFEGIIHPFYLSPEDKRNIIAKASQTYCPQHANNKDLICRYLAPVLPPFEIPEEIHAMSGGGEGYVTGGLYNADLVLEVVYLTQAMASPSSPFDLNSARVLDFGGSSGRSITTLKAAFPGIQAHVSDPIRKSIEWVNNNTSGVQGYASPIHPPMTYKKNSFDLIFAISIWSHYNYDNAAFEWFDEMHRLLDKKHGGYLVITTHGWTAAQSWAIDEGTSSLCLEAFRTKGHCYVAAFPGNVDWDPDTKNPDWGMSWVDPQWLKNKLSNKWTMHVVLTGRSDCLQDVIVLQPR